MKLVLVGALSVALWWRSTTHLTRWRCDERRDAHLRRLPGPFYSSMLVSEFFKASPTNALEHLETHDISTPMILQRLISPTWWRLRPLAALVRTGGHIADCRCLLSRSTAPDLRADIGVSSFVLSVPEKLRLRCAPAHDAAEVCWRVGIAGGSTVLHLIAYMGGTLDACCPALVYRVNWSKETSAMPEALTPLLSSLQW